MRQTSSTVGVLALQGDFAEHISMLDQLHVNSLQVRTIQDLECVDRLIIPGGESTVMSRLLLSTGLMKAIASRFRKGSLPIFGTCAGVILLAKHVTGKNVPQTLQLMDITVDRNAYGTQMQSFDHEVRVEGLQRGVDAAFIRAPKITHIGKNVNVLASFRSSPVLVRQGLLLGATFHSEVNEDPAIHQLFLALR